MKNQGRKGNLTRFVVWAALNVVLLIGCGGGGGSGGGGSEGVAPVSPPAITGFAYVANMNDNNLSQYSIGADGKLTPMSPATVLAGYGPFSVTVDPSKRFAYVVNSAGANVSQYAIGADGKLTPMSPATVAAGRTPAFVAVDPRGRFAYVANAEDNNISQYTIGADGKLTPMSPATVGAGSTPTSVTVDPSGRFAYVTNWWADRPMFHFGGRDNVSQYMIGSDGKLTPMSPATVEAGVGPNSIVIDPSGRFAYVVNAYRAPVTDYIRTNNVSQYTVGADGKLTPMFPASVSTGLMPYQVTVDPEGRFVYVANYWDGNISQYKIGADGKLTQLSPAKVPAGNGPHSVAVDPNGWFAYVANRHDNNVTQYAIGVDGKLTPISPAIVPAGYAPAFITTTGPAQ